MMCRMKLFIVISDSYNGGIESFVYRSKSEAIKDIKKVFKLSKKEVTSLEKENFVEIGNEYKPTNIRIDEHKI